MNINDLSMIDKEIISFIAENKVATVCCVEADHPYCFNCYYSFIEESGLLIYKSSFGTKHEAILEKNKMVAGTIIPEQIELTTLRGIQFEGIQLAESLELSMKASASYYLKFPFAMAMPGKIYVIEMQSVKLTDNSRGFGFKQSWIKQ